MNFAYYKNTLVQQRLFVRERGARSGHLIIMPTIIANKWWCYDRRSIDLACCTQHAYKQISAHNSSEHLILMLRVSCTLARRCCKRGKTINLSILYIHRLVDDIKGYTIYQGASQHGYARRRSLHCRVAVASTYLVLASSTCLSVVFDFQTRPTLLDTRDCRRAACLALNVLGKFFLNILKIFPCDSTLSRFW